MIYQDTQVNPISGDTIGPSSGLNFLWLEITRKCNLQCVHCYAESSPQQALKEGLLFDDWLRIMKKAREVGCEAVQFIGGEPTIHPDLPRLIIAAREEGYKFIEVYTNGTIFSENLLDLFAAHKIHLAFSVYSSIEEVHDRVTRKPGSLSKTLRVISRAVEMGLPTRVGIIKMEENAQGCEETVEFIRQLGVQDVKVDVERGIGRGRRERAVEPVQELCGACWDSKLAVDADGNVFPCVFSRFATVGNSRHESLSTLLQSPKLRAFREEVFALSRKRTEGELSALDCNPAAGVDIDCIPHGCGPTDDCRPECSPPCSPSEPCKPQCAPYCNPECNPFAGCRPK